ncbi:hypothetical protein RJ639_028256 [Escallonia herrerae]|uniref:HIT domain-containing protein n=1 Tax=Escallonia herrerae TaxID=1293975 RepID=A0AA88XAJ6_9ASTE|nr:hypothetical protein RJ639_028256 [Escallonia herrerae]
MVKLLAPSLSSAKGIITHCTSRPSLRPIAATSNTSTTARAAFNHRLHTARFSSSSTHNRPKAILNLSSHFITFTEISHRWIRRSLNSDVTKLTPRKYSTTPIFRMPWSISALFFLVNYYVYALYVRREVKRFVDLTTDETSDLWITAKKVGSRLEHHHKASSLTFAIQDGPEAGQTVPHVHIHIIPRKIGDFEKNDEIYDAIDLKEKELKQKLDLDKERKDRSLEEMAREADEYRNLFS